MFLNDTQINEYALKKSHGIEWIRQRAESEVNFTR